MTGKKGSVKFSGDSLLATIAITFSLRALAVLYAPFDSRSAYTRRSLYRRGDLCLCPGVCDAREFDRESLCETRVSHKSIFARAGYRPLSGEPSVVVFSRQFSFYFIFFIFFLFDATAEIERRG